MITYAVVNPASYVPPLTPLTIYGVDQSIKYLRIENNSPLQLSITLSGAPFTIAEFWQKDIAIPTYFQGTVVITSTVVISSASHAQASQLTIQGLTQYDGGGGLDAAIPQQSVTATASGAPLFSTSILFATTATVVQALNIFNPPNSGTNFTFHGALVYTNDATIPIANFITSSGADKNLASPVPAVSHTGAAIPPVSFAHCTGQDLNIGIAGTTIDTLYMQAQVIQNFLIFPDNFELTPGNNLTLLLSSGASGKTIQLIMRWAENTFTPQQGGKPVSFNFPFLNAKDFGAFEDGIHDDTAALNNALVSAGGAGAEIFLTGMCLISASLLVSSPNIKMSGAGWGCGLILANGMNDYAIKFNGANMTGIEFSNFKIDCNGANQAASSGGILANGSYRNLFDHLWIHNPYEAGIKFFQGPGGGFGFQNWVRQCQIEGGINAAAGGPGRGIWFNQSDENLVMGNHFQDNGSTFGSDQCHIRDEAGLQIIAENDFVGGVSGVKAYGSRTKILGNTFDGVGRNSTLIGNVELAGPDHMVANNYFLNTGFSSGANTVNAIVVNGIAGSVIVNNEFENDTTGSNGTRSFISMNATSSNSKVEGNKFKIPGGSVTFKVEQAAGTTANQIRNNGNYNPFGSLTAPGIPATTVALPNNTGFDCMVQIIGGTVTNVAIGGVNTGLIVGWFKIPALQTITLTYTVAPTWQWFGD